MYSWSLRSIETFLRLNGTFEGLLDSSSCYPNLPNPQSLPPCLTTPHTSSKKLTKFRCVAPKAQLVRIYMQRTLIVVNNVVKTSVVATYCQTKPEIVNIWLKSECWQGEVRCQTQSNLLRFTSFAKIYIGITHTCILCVHCILLCKNQVLCTSMFFWHKQNSYTHLSC